MRKETQLGLFILLGIIALAITIMTIQSINIERGYRLNVTFNDVSNLMEKAWVRISGVKVGKIETVSLYDKRVKVVIWIKRSIKLHTDAKASIQSTGILGVKYIELTLGSDDLPLLKDGDFIEGKDPMSLDKMLSDGLSGIGDLTKSLGGDLGPNLAELVRNAKEITERLNTQLSDEKVSVIINNLKELSENAKKVSADLAEITGDEKMDIKDIFKNLKASTEKLDRILTKVDNGETTIGRLLSDKEMGDNLKASVENIKIATNEAKNTLSRFTLFRSYWDYNMRYSNNSGEFKSDVGIMVRPYPEKFYYLGASNVGDTIDPSAEKRNTFNLNIGKELKIHDKPFATVYAGLLRSTGGAGFRIKPLYAWNPWNNIDLTVEMYDFTRVSAAGTKKPKVNAGVRIAPTRWLYVGTMAEDVTEASDLHTSVNLLLEDRDLTYMLALVGLAKP